MAIVALRQRIPDRVIAYAIRLGLGLSLLGMLAAVPMVVLGAAPRSGLGQVAGAHTVGRPDGGPGLPLIGWSTVGGDLRIGHVVGLHGLQAMPLLAVGLTVFFGARLSAAVRARLLVVAGTGYGLFTVSLTGQALRGQSLVHPDVLTLAVWRLIVAGSVAAGGLVLCPTRRSPTGCTSA